MTAFRLTEETCQIQNSWPCSLEPLYNKRPDHKQLNPMAQKIVKRFWWVSYGHNEIPCTVYIIQPRIKVFLNSYRSFDLITYWSAIVTWQVQRNYCKKVKCCHEFDVGKDWRKKWGDECRSLWNPFIIFLI